MKLGPRFRGGRSGRAGLRALVDVGRPRALPRSPVSYRCFRGKCPARPSEAGNLPISGREERSRFWPAGAAAVPSAQVDLSSRDSTTPSGALEAAVDSPVRCRLRELTAARSARPPRAFGDVLDGVANSTVSTSRYLRCHRGTERLPAPADRMPFRTRRHLPRRVEASQESAESTQSL
jgi:hypothetical protein